MWSFGYLDIENQAKVVEWYKHWNLPLPAEIAERVNPPLSNIKVVTKEENSRLTRSFYPELI
ncbi:hypothetical protein D3C83_203750 [compost metagenome]